MKSKYIYILCLVFVLLVILFLDVVISLFYNNVEWFVPDKILGWKHNPQLNTTFYGSDFTSHILVNYEGFSDVNHNLNKDPNIVRIVVLGDSFTEAWQVDFYKSFPRLLEKSLNNVEVLNFGVSSFGTDQEYLTYKHYARKYDPDIVIVVFSNNDVRDNYEILYNLSSKINLMQNKPFFNIDRGVLSLKNFTPYRRPFTNSILRKSSLLSLINNLVFRKNLEEKDLPEGYKIFSESYDYNWDNAWNITFKILGEFKEQVEKDKSKFILVIGVDSIQVSEEEQNKLFSKYKDAKNIKFNFSKTSTIMNDFCRKNNITCINLLDDFKNSEENLFVEDGHWNEKGHELVEKVIINKIIKG